MKKRILLAHNGVFGAKAVEPFAGKELEPRENSWRISYGTRDFTFAYSDDDANFYREQRFGEPSDWAIAREQERAARG